MRRAASPPQRKCLPEFADPAPRDFEEFKHRQRLTLVSVLEPQLRGRLRATLVCGRFTASKAKFFEITRDAQR